MPFDPSSNTSLVLLGAHSFMKYNNLKLYYNHQPKGAITFSNLKPYLNLKPCEYDPRPTIANKPSSKRIVHSLSI